MARIKNGKIQIGHDSFDTMAIEYNIIEMKQLYILQRDFPDEYYLPIWDNYVVGCRYINFLITIKDNDSIQDVINALINNDTVIRVITRNKRSEQ